MLVAPKKTVSLGTKYSKEWTEYILWKIAFTNETKYSRMDQVNFVEDSL